MAWRRRRYHALGYRSAAGAGAPGLWLDRTQALADATGRPTWGLSVMGGDDLKASNPMREEGGDDELAANAASVNSSGEGDNDAPDPSAEQKPNGVLALLGSAVMGLWFGFLFEKSHVYEPASIRGQFNFEKWIMMKVRFMCSSACIQRDRHPSSPTARCAP